MLVLTTNQMKRAEQLAADTGLSYMEMMRNAGNMAYQYCKDKFDILTKRTVVICGSGNNAGDGFVVAKKIRENGGVVSVVMCNGVPATKESQEAFAEMQLEHIEIINLSSQPEMAKERFDMADVIIDAVFGTGFHGELASNIRNVFEYINDTTAKKIALDIPSGVNADTGISSANHLKADVTLAFAALKPAHVNEQCKKACGHIEVLDIGIPSNVLYMVQSNATMITMESVVPLFPIRHQNTNKGNYGKFLNISGSRTMPGAAMMSTLAAMRMGAGVTTLVTPQCVADICAANLMEAMTFPVAQNQQGSISSVAVRNIEVLLAQSNACLIGCGLSVTSDTKQIVNFVIENTKSNLIIDADGLNCIAEDVSVLEKLKVKAVITPHPGEMARLTGLTIEKLKHNAYRIAHTFAQKYNVIVVLKGHKTIIATPEGEMFENSTGNAGLAKGGSGDVLAGMIGGLLAQGFDPKYAAIGAVYLHGLIADQLSEQMSQYSMLARDIIEQIPYTLKSLEPPTA